MGGIHEFQAIHHMKLHLAIVIAASVSTTLSAQTSVPLTAPEQPTVEMLIDKPVPIDEPVTNVGSELSSPGQCDLLPLQRKYPGYGGEALNDSAVNSVYFMTNLNTSGPGSISAAPSGSYVCLLYTSDAADE